MKEMTAVVQALNEHLNSSRKTNPLVECAVTDPPSLLHFFYATRMSFFSFSDEKHV